MKILLSPGTGITPGVGGQGSFCAHLSGALAAAGHEVCIWTEAGWTAHAAEHNLRCLDTRQVATERFDVLHVNGPGRGALALGALRRLPTVVTHEDYSTICLDAAWTPKGCDANGRRPGPCRDCPHQGRRAYLRIRALRALCSLPHVRNVAISNAVRTRIGLPRSETILHPVPILDAGRERGERRVAYAGRLVEHKGVDLLIGALPSLPDVMLEVAGAGPDRARLEAQAKALGVADRVHFLGMISLDDVYALYASSSAVAIPSRYGEPFGYSLAEAMALGVPAVASRGGAFTELLADERGWLCGIDSSEPWASALSEAMGPEGRRRAERALAYVATELAPARVAGRYLETYRSLI